MAEIVNDRDLLIMAAVPRFTPPTDRGMFLTPPAAIFRASGDGATSTPPSFTFKATLLNMAGVVSFAASNGTKLTVNATKNEATLDFAAFAAAGAEAVYVTATITVDGVPYTQQAIVTKVSDGNPGQPGSRGAGHFYVAGSSWSDTVAEMATPGSSMVDDVVTISSGTFVMEKRWTGSAWVNNGVVIDGKLIVPQSITAGTIDSRGLSIRDSAGNVILAAGSALAPDYAAAGTKNIELTPAIAAAATSTFTAADGLMFDFDVDYMGWSGVNGATLSAGSGYITLSSANADPMLVRSFNFAGSQYDKVRMKLRRTQGSTGTGWDGTLFSNNEGVDAYVSVPNPNIGTDWKIIEWDMGSQPKWLAQTITRIRIDLGSTPQDKFDIDWIAVGKYAAAPSVGAVDAARVAAISAAAIDAQAKADAAGNMATSAAATYAAAQAALARTNAQAYADGKVTAEEQRAINDAAAKAEAARVAAVNAAAADATAKAAVAATMADFDKVRGRFEDSSNIVKKSSFADNAIGGWSAQGVEAISGTNAGAVPYTKQLVSHARDCLETNNYFSVTANETLYYEAWLNTEATSLQCSFGVIYYDKNGQFAGTNGFAPAAPGQAWARYSGGGKVPAAAVSALPWLWQDGTDFSSANWLRAAGMWIGRHARGATVGADQSNLNAGLGGRNLLNNTLPNNIGAYTSTFADGATGSLVGYYGPGHDWAVFSPENRGCIGVRCLGNVGARMDIYAPRVTITPSQRYEFSATASSHRARSWVNIAWYRADGSYISEVAGIPLGDYAWNTGWVGSPPPRVVVFAVAPADAVTAMPFLRMTKQIDSSTDSYLFASQLYMGEALPSQTVGSPYSPGLMEARDLAVAAQAALQNKIDATASSILRAPITITTGGGLVVGSLTYDATTGLRGSGSGMAITPYGQIAHNGTKYTFGLSGGTGDVFFGGELQAAYGTFGGLRIGPGGYIAQGAFDGSWAWPAAGSAPGFLIHPNGALFGNRNDPNNGFFSIGANGAIEAPGLSYSGRQMYLDRVVITNPVLSPFNLGINNTQNQYSYSAWRGSTDAFLGVYVASINTGTDGASFNWSVQGPWPCWLVLDTNSTRMQLHVNMKGGAPLAGDSGDFYINCSATKGGNTVNTQQLVTVTAS